MPFRKWETKELKNNNMYPAIENNSYGLMGFWGNLFKSLSKIVADAVSVVPIIGPTLSRELHKIIEVNISWAWKGASDYNLTSAEETLLTQFTQLKLAPFVKLLSQDLSNALQSQDFSAQLN